MNFGEAIASGFKNYVNFQGRTQRSGYWWWFLFVLLGNLFFGVLDGWIFGFSQNGSGGPLGLIFGLVILLPGIALGVRRLHDIDRSGWWLLIALIPLIGFLVLIYFFVQKGTDGPNRFGPDPLGGGDAGGGFTQSSIPRSGE